MNSLPARKNKQAENKQGTVYRIDNRYIVLIKKNPDARSQTEWIAERFHLDMEAFGGLPGYEYSPMLIDTSRISLRRLTPSRIRQLDEFLQLAIKNISEHGENWNTKKFWEGTPYWRD